MRFFYSPSIANRKMEVLGEQMEAQQKVADRATRGIIGDALANERPGSGLTIGHELK